MGRKVVTPVEPTTPLIIERTINLKKALHKRTQKKRAPRAIREIKKLAAVELGTPDVRVKVELNKHLWSRGIRHVPRKVRVRFIRKFNEDTEAEHRMYTLVELVEGYDRPEHFVGVQSKKIEDDN